MATAEQKLTEYVADAHAMEKSVLQMLDSMISTTRDPELRGELEHHRQETQQHEQRLRGRLEEMKEGPSAIKQAGAMASAMGKALVDRVRSDKPIRNARDGYATEHLEIASYELLERVANRAGDPKTAEIARLNRRDEEEMARKIAAHWDKFTELTLVEEGVTT
jgi:ferritin-like metal-binding protein YciE